MELAVIMLAARRLMEHDKPEILDLSETCWRHWIGSERRSGTRPANIPNLIVAAALTSIDDLHLHLGLMQLLSVREVRCSVVLTFPTDESVALARARALRLGWEGFVAIRSSEDWLRESSRLPPDHPVVMFKRPTALPQSVAATAAGLLNGSLPQVFASSRTNGYFLGSAKDLRGWAEARTEELAEALLSLSQIEAVDLVDLGDADPEFSAPASVNWSPDMGSREIFLPDLRPGDEFRITTSDRTTAAETLVRLDGTLHDSSARIRLRLPPTLATVEPSRIGVHLACPEGVDRSAEITIDFRPEDLQPWMLTAFLNRGGGGNSVMQAFAAGVGCRIAYAEDEPVELREIPAVWGVLRQSDRILEQARRQRLYFFYVDHAYFERGHGRNYRITRNRYEAGPIRACPTDRFDSLDVHVRPWRRGGREIIVCPPTEFFVQAHGCSDWLDSTLETLSRITDRPVHIREKPQPGQALVPLSQELETAHALVTHSSNVAVEAVCLGTPVFVSPSSAAAPVGSTDLRSIESPLYPDRSAWLSHLAYSQYSLEEIGDGRAWRMLRELEERELV